MSPVSGSPHSTLIVGECLPLMHRIFGQGNGVGSAGEAVEG